MGALLLIVVVIVAVAALASFVSIAEANASTRQAYITSVKDENLQITGAQFNVNPGTGLTDEWLSANLTIRNTNTAPSTLSFIKVANNWLRSWEVSGQKFENKSDVFYGNGRSGIFALYNLIIPARGTVQVNLNFTTIVYNGVADVTTKDLGLLRSSSFPIELLTAAGNFFTTVYYPPTAALTESVVQTPFLSATRDLLRFDGGQSTNGNGTIQSYQWTIQVPPQNWDNMWDNTVQTFTASGRIFTYPEDLLSQGCFATLPCALDTSGPIRVTLEVTDSNGFTSSTQPTVIMADSLVSPPSNLAIVSNTVSGTCYNMQPGFCTASLVVELTDVFGNAVSGQVVDFSVLSGNVTNINPTFEATDSSGEASTTVTFGLNGGVVEAVSEVDSALKVLQEETGTLQLAVSPPSPTIDSGQSVTLSAIATGGSGVYSSYDWYSGMTCSGSTVGTASSYATGTLTTTTAYCVQVTDSHKGTASTTVTVTVNSALTAGAIAPSAPTIDSGQVITLTANPSGGTMPYTYQWYTGAGCTAPITGAVGATYSASPTSTTIYYYKVTDSSSAACSAGDTVTVNSAFTAGAITPGSPAIDDGTTVTLTANPSGGTTPYTIQWYTESGCTGPLANTGSTYLVTPTTTATYYVEVTDSTMPTPQSQCSVGDTVTVNPKLTSPTISSNYAAIDYDQSATLSITTPFSGGTPAYSCQWMEEAPTVSPLGSAVPCSAGGTISAPTGMLSTVGLYTFELQVTDSSYNSPVTMTSNQISITVNAALTAPTVTAASNSIAPGTSTTLTTSALAMDGTPSGGTYTCQWLEEAPGTTGFSAMGSSFSCTAGTTYGISTGPLATAGNWIFEFQVTDSGNPPEVATSASTPASTVNVT